MLGNLRKKYANKISAKNEQKRLQGIFNDFQKEYWELCKKYKAQWTPILNHDKSGQFFKLRLQLQSYEPKDIEVNFEPKKEIVGNGASGGGHPIPANENA